MTYRVLALDLDGTLLTSDHRILPDVRDAVARISTQAVVLLVTGRHHTAARPYYHELALTTPIICCNGTYIYDYQQQSVVEENAIPRSSAAQFLELAQQYGLNLVMYVTDRMVYSIKKPLSYLPPLEQWAAQCQPDIRPQIHGVPSLEQVLAESRYIWKFVAEGDIENIREFARQPWIAEHFTAEQSWHNRIDFAWQGNTKGHRLLTWLNTHQYTPEETVAIGDNHNDVSMIQLAGLGVAMANAEEAVKAMADCVTREGNNGRGVLDIIQTCFG